MEPIRRRTFTELISLPTFEEKLKYLFIGNKIGEETFGGRRMLNQDLYMSVEWQRFRRQYLSEIAAMNGEVCDLMQPGMPIRGKIILHHIEPLTIEDILNRSEWIFSRENVVPCSNKTHQYIHYGGDIEFATRKDIVERKPNDTCPWRNNAKYIDDPGRLDSRGCQESNAFGCRSRGQ